MQVLRRGHCNSESLLRQTFLYEYVARVGVTIETKEVYQVNKSFCS